MNDRGRSVLLAAAWANRPQAFGRARDGDAICGTALLEEALGESTALPWLNIVAEMGRVYDLGLLRGPVTCPECGRTRLNEYVLLQHLNDHGLDWLGLANKMPDTEPTP